MKNEIFLFEHQDVKLEVNMKDETVWLNVKQISRLFGRDEKTIRKHINNVLKEELDYNMVVANFATTTKHGSLINRTQTRMVEYYNLDMIISIGYRVKSNNGVVFRKWANNILKDYLIKGYAVNKKRLEVLEKTVTLVDIASRIDETDTKDVIRVINCYSKSLDLIDDYDYNNIKQINRTISSKKITYEDCIEIIKKLKYNEKSNLFALERKNGLKSIIGNIYQTFDYKDIYPSIEVKAAHFLYFIVKDHVFVDGNKRIGAALFIYFLDFYGIIFKDKEKVIDNNTLAALTILIAISNPKEKNLLVSLITHFLI